MSIYKQAYGDMKDYARNLKERRKGTRYDNWMDWVDLMDFIIPYCEEKGEALMELFVKCGMNPALFYTACKHDGDLDKVNRKIRELERRDKNETT